MYGINQMTQFLSEIAKQKWRHIVVVVLLLVLNGALGIYVSTVQNPDLIEKQKTWSSLRRQNSSAVRVDAETLYRLGNADLTKLKTRIPAKREFARILGDLYEMASSDAVDVEKVSYKMVAIKEDALQCYELSFAVNGSYAATKSFLADLLKNQELMVVDSVSLSNQDMFTEHVTMDLRLTLYLRGGV
jgi:type IV pilus assembly protein PilO